MSLHLIDIEPAPLTLDPRPCELCALTIDRHDRVDTAEGPESFCRDDLSPDEMTLPELERRAELRRQEDIAAILARWEKLDPPDVFRTRDAEPYHPAASVVDAFWHVVNLRDPERFKC